MVPTVNKHLLYIMAIKKTKTAANVANIGLLKHSNDEAKMQNQTSSKHQALLTEPVNHISQISDKRKLFSKNKSRAI